jgi:hypothetical protein
MRNPHLLSLNVSDEITSVPLTQNVRDEVDQILLTPDPQNNVVGGLAHVLTSPTLHALFHSFCEQQYCEENLLFWEDVEKYRLTTPNERTEYCNYIIQVFMLLLL